MVNHVLAGAQRLIDLRDLKHERLLMTLEAFEVEGYLPLILDPLVVRRYVSHASLRSR